MAKKKPVPKKDCPACVKHSRDAGRFYDKPPKIGKILKSGHCSECGFKERK